MDSNYYKKTIFKVGIITIIVNLVLALGKAIVGIISGTQSLISDAVHSGSDVLSTVIVIIGARMGAKDADDDHQYGHERMESIASLLLAFVLCGTAAILGYSAIVNIINYDPESVHFDSSITIALICAIASIVIKFWMFIYSTFYAKKLNSVSLKADAYHHLSDSLSSFGSLAGIIGIMIGKWWGILDPIASLIISIFIIKVSFDIGKEGIDQLIDKAAPVETIEGIKKVASSVEGVISVKRVKTRLFSNKIYVEISFYVDGHITVESGHQIAKNVRNAIETSYENVKRCTTHIDPFIVNKI